MRESFNLNVREAEYKKLEADLDTYIGKKDFSLKEIQDAYFMLCGVTDESLSERVAGLLQEMETMTSAHYPLNRFARLIEAMAKYESGFEEYKKFVEQMDVEENDRRILLSVARERRAGVLSVYKVSTNRRLFQIPLDNLHTLTSNMAAIKVMRELEAGFNIVKVVPSQTKMEVAFEEK